MVGFKALIDWMNQRSLWQRWLTVGGVVAIGFTLTHGLLLKTSAPASNEIARVTTDPSLHDLEAESLRHMASQYLATQQALTALQREQAQHAQTLSQRLDALEQTATSPPAPTSETPETPRLPLPTFPSDERPTPSPLGVVENSLPTDLRLPQEDSNANAPPSATPYYTIPANATALKATLMTALIGRIPNQGHVHDPYPFKVILSAENLAANGFTLPHVTGMIASGTAIGDLNLRSVRGDITSVTFLFADGTIHTTGEAAQPSTATPQRLGWITDDYGNPALRGQLITNAPAHLGTLLALGGAKGAASALAQQQLSTQLGNPSVQSLTGDVGHFVVGQSATTATDQALRWYSERIQASFDAIYLPAGSTVAIHFTQAIALDHHPNDRRLFYDTLDPSDPHIDLD